MKFGETFTEYLHGEQEQFLNKCSHVQYKRLKKVLKRCRICRAVQVSCGDKDGEGHCASSDPYEYDNCQLCDQVFFDELAREASETGVYADSFHMVELDLLLKKRCPVYWKERKNEERALMLKQSKEYYDLQTKYAIGY